MARFVLERIVSSVVMCVALTLLVFLAFFRGRAAGSSCGGTWRSRS